MSGNIELSPTNPELQQPRIDVDQGGATKATEDVRVDGVVEVDQQIRSAEHRFGSVLARVDELGSSGPVRLGGRIQQRPVTETVACHPLEKARDQRPRTVQSSTRDAFQPVDIAPQLLQAMGVLHVHPEVTTDLRLGRHLIRRKNYNRHFGALCGGTEEVRDIPEAHEPYACSLQE